MPNTNEKIVKDAAITTGGISHGLLNPYQAETFLKQTFEATPLMKEIRHVLRREKTGEIDKIGIGRHILRAKVENTDDGYRAKPNFDVLQYATNAVRVPWEITEEALRENIEGQGFETTVANLMTKQIGVDEEDLLLNGDEAAADATAFSSATNYTAGQFVTYNGKLYRFVNNHSAGAWDADDVEEMGDAGDIDFVKLDNGFIKQIKKYGHKMDASSYSVMNLDLYYKMLSLVPNKYNNGSLRWIMSPTRKQQWDLFLYQAIISQGGSVPEFIFKSPASIPALECPNMPNDAIILSDPKNLVEVNTYSVQIRKTTEGKEAIMQDKRFYVVHFDLDTLIEETDATGIITGLPEYNFS